ncbi:MAG TPA: response regulator transcription factor [Gammaproteobacteria bacterium]|nr:response regulator transcription factor [Gammaproteobacteria bacterium]
MVSTELKNCKVVLADDHSVFRLGLRALLKREGIEVVGEAADGAEALRLACNVHPDVVVMDLSMPVMNGLEVTREIARCAPEVRTILLTVHTEYSYVVEALRVGVSGYVLKSQAASDVVEAIRQVTAGAIYLSWDVAPTAVQA